VPSALLIPVSAERGRWRRGRTRGKAVFLRPPAWFCVHVRFFRTQSHGFQLSSITECIFTQEKTSKYFQSLGRCTRCTRSREPLGCAAHPSAARQTADNGQPTASRMAVLTFPPLGTNFNCASLGNNTV